MASAQNLAHISEKVLLIVGLAISTLELFDDCGLSVAFLDKLGIQCLALLERFVEPFILLLAENCFIENFADGLLSPLDLLV